MIIEFLETLVKLAACGTSGICIFTVFWCGRMIRKLPVGVSRDRHTTIRFFMVMCLAIGIISAGTTISAAYWDYKRISRLKSENTELVHQTEQQETNLVTLKSDNSELIRKTKEQDKQFATLKSNVSVFSRDIKQHVAKLATIQPNSPEYIKRKSNGRAG